MDGRLDPSSSRVVRSYLRGLTGPGASISPRIHAADEMFGDSDWSRGIVFLPRSETVRLDAREYGTSYVTEEFVRTASRDAAGDADLAVFPFGFCAVQDLYVLSKPPLRERPALEVSRFPRGDLDRFEIGAGPGVLVAGWVSSSGGEPPPTVRLWVGDEPVSTLRAAGLPAEAARWEFSFDRSRIDPDEVIRVEAQSARGFSNILAMGTLRPHLPFRPLSRSE